MISCIFMDLNQIWFESHYGESRCWFFVSLIYKMVIIWQASEHRTLSRGVFFMRVKSMVSDVFRHLFICVIWYCHIVSNKLMYIIFTLYHRHHTDKHFFWCSDLTLNVGLISSSFVLTLQKLNLLSQLILLQRRCLCFLGKLSNKFIIPLLCAQSHIKYFKIQFTCLRFLLIMLLSFRSEQDWREIFNCGFRFKNLIYF